METIKFTHQGEVPLYEFPKNTVILFEWYPEFTENLPSYSAWVIREYQDGQRILENDDLELQMTQSETAKYNLKWIPLKFIKKENENNEV